MSRLIIKNLPKTITETKIREIFGAKGTITDVQLKYTPEGKFRQFAFIGYHDENSAQEAVKELHNSHISTNKIAVEQCALLGDSSKPKAWSKYAKDSTAYKKAHPESVIEPEKPKKEKKKENEIVEKYKDDPEFEEFIQLHAPKESHVLLSKPESENEEEDDEESGDKVANQKVTDTEYMKSLVKKKTKAPKEKIKLFTLKLRNLPYNCKKKAIKDFFRPLAPYSIRIPRNIKGIAYVAFKTEGKLNKALLKDRSFIDGKRVTVVKYDDNKNETNKEPGQNSKWKSQEEALQHEEDIAESGRIFIRNLAYTTTEDDINGMFSKYGPVTEVNLPIDTITRKLKGFGIITFLMPEHAVKAYSELDGSVLHGRMLHLLPGKAKDAPDEAQDSTNYKQKKAQKEKSQASSSHNWNSLFLGQNAVADVVAKTYGTSKEAVLDPHGDGSAAVRLALGETQIVAETRKYLEREGVVLDAFNQENCQRSKTAILVKNLPAETSSNEIRQLFEKHGVLSRLIFPPSGISAIVEFVEPSEARKAYKGLAYTKFKYLPLYLEWAPENSLTRLENTPTLLREQKPETHEEQETQEEEETNEDDEPEPDTTLYVKNLNFKTTDEELRKHFEGCGKISYATVAMKKNKEDPLLKLSLGYGFVRFFHKASADKALKTLQCTTLDGKTLELKRSERTLSSDVTSSKKKSKLTKQTGTKILVRNVPFQANQKEVMELFRTFGEIKALRLPKKMGGGNAHRGFAFVDFFTTSDAKKAFQALSQSTHLYGRRLVLEWASAEEGVDQLRKRTADHFHQEKEVRSKKSVLDIEKV